MKEKNSISADIIKAEARSLGFSACGIAPAQPVSEEFSRLYMQGINRGTNGTMDYLARNLEKRFDPRLLVEGTQSIISLALNYYPRQHLRSNQLQFAWYAYGKDYHDVVRQRVAQLLGRLRTLFPHLDLQGRAFCDTAPVPERYWAWKCGLGWIGRSTQLVVPRAGSSFFLGELFLSAEVDVYDSPQPSRCGSCRACIEACPMKALSDEGLDARRCLSYLTIEHRGDIPKEASERMGNCIYGCDCCIKACPHMRFATPTEVDEFAPSPEFLSMTPEEWGQLTVEQYRTLFKGSAVKRAKFEGLQRNINACLESRKK